MLIHLLGSASAREKVAGGVPKQAVSGIVESWTGRFSRRCLRKSGAGWSLGFGGGPTIAMK